MLFNNPESILLGCGSLALRGGNLDFKVVNDNANYTRRYSEVRMLGFRFFDDGVFFP